VNPGSERIQVSCKINVDSWGDLVSCPAVGFKYMSSGYLDCCNEETDYFAH
jgi:hypothetical protein